MRPPDTGVEKGRIRMRLQLQNLILSRRVKFLMILLLIVVILFFIQQWIFAQRLPYYIQLKAKLQDEAAKLASARETASNLPVLKKAVERAEAELAAARERLGVTFDDRDSFLLAAQPKETKVRVTLFQPLEEEKRGIFSVQPFQVTVSGDYPSVMSYLLYLESLPAWTQVRELKISARGEKQGEVEASFVIDLYEIGLEGESAPFNDNQDDKQVAGLPPGRRNIFEPVAINQPGKPPEQSTPLSPSPSPKETDASEKKAGPLSVASTASYTFPSIDGKSARAAFPWLEWVKVLRNVGPYYYAGSRKIAIAGREFNRGIVVEVDGNRPVAEMVLDLYGRFVELQGYAGVEDETQNSSGSFILTFLGDERELLKTPILKPGAYPHYVELNVTGVKRLIVRVEWQEGGPGDYDRILAALANMIFVKL